MKRIYCSIYFFCSARTKNCVLSVDIENRVDNEQSHTQNQRNIYTYARASARSPNHLLQFDLCTDMVLRTSTTFLREQKINNKKWYSNCIDVFLITFLYCIYHTLHRHIYCEKRAKWSGKKWTFVIRLFFFFPFHPVCMSTRIRERNKAKNGLFRATHQHTWKTHTRTTRLPSYHNNYNSIFTKKTFFCSYLFVWSRNTFVSRAAKPFMLS